MNSWDCFDTLIARRYFHPKTVFDEVGRRIGDPTFKEKRIAAEKASNKTYADIYTRLPGIDPQIELDVELEHNFPIMENIMKVQDGDLIISDMYLPQSFVEKLLRNCGLKKDITVIVTPDGKKKGWIWKDIKQKYKIDCHTGDNIKSDVESAKNHGLKTNHFFRYDFNDIEKEVYFLDKSLAYWMRYTRLVCHYTDRRSIMFWNDQADINLPVLALATKELPDTKIAFSYRDCRNWHKLYEAMTGKPGIRLDVSRQMYLNPNTYFDRYMEKIKAAGATIVDLQGKGKSIWKYYKGSPPSTIYIGGKTPEYIKQMIAYNTKSLEKHNCLDIGPVIDWNADGPIRGENDHPIDVAKIQLSAMDTAIKAASWFNIKKNNDLLLEMVKKMDMKSFTKSNIAWSKFNDSNNALYE